MSVKFLLYIFVLPFVIWALDGLNINFLFKKNRIAEARIIYMIIAMALTYLVVNFLYDFFEVTKIY
ncbi:MAG: DUF1146 family protein [Bacilli bacterium]|jgi:uncharacterized integral membrane protein (TIGR02327 family)